jgi:hypothetical protein
MGFDLTGLNPKGATPKPTLENWQTATEEEKQNYRDALDEWESITDGAYFRASMGWWTALLVLSNIANDEQELNIDMNDWAFNDNGGCFDAENCIKLADAIEALIPELIPFWNEIDPMKTFYCCASKYWEEWGENGRTKAPDDEILYKLNDMFNIYQFIEGPVQFEGKQFTPSSTTKKSHILEFIHFLRNCGGFIIY